MSIKQPLVMNLTVALCIIHLHSVVIVGKLVGVPILLLVLGLLREQCKLISIKEYQNFCTNLDQ